MAAAPVFATVRGHGASATQSANGRTFPPAAGPAMFPAAHAVWPVALLFCGVLLVGRTLDGAWVLLVMMAVGEGLRRLHRGRPPGTSLT